MNEYLEFEENQRQFQRSPSQGSQGSGRADNDRREDLAFNPQFASVSTAEKSPPVVRRISVDDYLSQFDKNGKLLPKISIINLDESNPETVDSSKLLDLSEDESDDDVFGADDDEAPAVPEPKRVGKKGSMPSVVQEASNESDSWAAFSARNNDDNESL